MQLWFPSALTEPLSPRAELASKSVDPELEFDKEVYPIGISLAEVAIIGRISWSKTDLPYCALFTHQSLQHCPAGCWQL